MSQESYFSSFLCFLQSTVRVFSVLCIFLEIIQYFIVLTLLGPRFMTMVFMYALNDKI